MVILEVLSCIRCQMIQHFIILQCLPLHHYESDAEYNIHRQKYERMQQLQE
jgi:hypothetical protein